MPDIRSETPPDITYEQHTKYVLALLRGKSRVEALEEIAREEPRAN